MKGRPETLSVLIGLASDRPGVGKSTAAQYLAEKYGFVIVSIGESVKSELDIMLRSQGFRYDESRKDEFRPALSWWTEFRLQNSGRDYWLQAVGQQLRSHRLTVVPDVRYPDEAEYLSELGGLVVKIERNDVIRSQLASEMALDSFRFKYVIENSEGDLGASMCAQLDEFLSSHYHTSVQCELRDGAQCRSRS